MTYSPTCLLCSLFCKHCWLFINPFVSLSTPQYIRFSKHTGFWGFGVVVVVVVDVVVVVPFVS